LKCGRQKRSFPKTLTSQLIMQSLVVSRVLLKHVHKAARRSGKSLGTRKRIFRHLFFSHSHRDTKNEGFRKRIRRTGPKSCGCHDSASRKSNFWQVSRYSEQGMFNFYKTFSFRANRKTRIFRSNDDRFFSN